MAVRWSNPSGGLGIQRFRVWPASTDSYSHTDLANNFDNVDAIIGVPSTGTWPPTTGIDGGIYAEVKKLQNERDFIGKVVYMFTPTANPTIPDGYAVANGQTLASGDHDFPGVAGSVTLPNLLHSFILGADPTKALGTAAAAVGNAAIDSPTGAPGPQATGGSNQHILVGNESPSHDHGGGNHDHPFQRQQLQLNEEFGGLNYLLNVRDFFDHTENTQFSGNIINSFGGDQPHENRPRWTALIPLIRVKFITSV